MLDEFTNNLDKEFELSLKDASGVLIKFILVKTYKSNDGLQCKNIAFKTEKTFLIIFFNSCYFYAE